jgi:hypothetical protein
LYSLADILPECDAGCGARAKRETTVDPICQAVLGNPICFEVEVAGTRFDSLTPRGVLADALDEAGRRSEAALVRGPAPGLCFSDGVIHLDPWDYESYGRRVDQGDTFFLVFRRTETAHKGLRRRLLAEGFRPVTDLTSGRYAQTPLAAALLAVGTVDGTAVGVEAWRFVGAA